MENTVPCPHCGESLSWSPIEGYVYYCESCDQHWGRYTDDPEYADCELNRIYKETIAYEKSIEKYFEK